MLGIRTQGGRIEGANETTELRRHPKSVHFTLEQIEGVEVVQLLALPKWETILLKRSSSDLVDLICISLWPVVYKPSDGLLMLLYTDYGLKPHWANRHLPRCRLAYLIVIRDTRNGRKGENSYKEDTFCKLDKKELTVSSFSGREPTTQVTRF